jgi:PAS domain S-box-containing protein
MLPQGSSPLDTPSDLFYRGIFDIAGDGLIVADWESGRVLEANPAAGVMYGYTRDELIGLPLAQLVRPDDGAAFLEQARAAVHGAASDARAIHVRRDASTFHVEIRWTAFADRERSLVLGVVRDVSARVLAERRLQQQVEAHAREQSTLLATSQTLASALELKPGLILDQLRLLIEYAQAGLYGLEDGALVVLAVRGSLQHGQAVPLRIPPEVPVEEESSLPVSQLTRIRDVWSDDPAAQRLRAFLGDQADAMLQSVRAWMWIPLMANGRLVGGIYIAHAEPDYFTAHHADLALTLANQAAITLVNARLYERAQMLAKLQERQRLAQELHDAVNQSLFSAGLIAEVLPRLWERDPDEGRRSLEDLRRLTRGALAEMRGLLAELRPAILTDTDLGDLLRQLGNALTGRTNVPVTVSVTGQGTLPPDVQVAIYRLCQEALSNVAKHAGAGHIAIHLRYDETAVALRIVDDGRGFDLGRVPAGRSGLAMMRERAESIGARLSITSNPSRGSEIDIAWAQAPEGADL